MFLSKTPYRLPLAGGGTDIDFYYKKEGGFLISASISEYMYTYISLRPFEKESLIQTTDTQFVDNNYKIENELIRETLKYFKIKDKVHVGCFSTMPTKTGIGSSSSLIVGLIKAISKFKKINLNNNQIIKLSYKIEREILGIDGGWQDQIMATLGGIRKIIINKNGQITTTEININKKILSKFQNKILLVFTKEIRDSSQVIKSQRMQGPIIIKKYNAIKDLAKSFEMLLKKEKFNSIGKLFHTHWLIKRELSAKITNNYLDSIYIKLMRNKSFVGGKIIGAGGGGFFLMVTNSINESKNFLKKNKLTFKKLSFEKNGSTILDG